MIISEGIWSKNAKDKEETVEFGSVTKIHNLQIWQVAKFRNTAPLHCQFDCFLTRFFLPLYKSAFDLNLVPLHIFVISLVLSTYISSIKLVTSINFQSINHSIKLAPKFLSSDCVSFTRPFLHFLVFFLVAKHLLMRRNQEMLG